MIAKRDLAAGQALNDEEADQALWSAYSYLLFLGCRRRERQAAEAAAGQSDTGNRRPETDEHEQHSSGEENAKAANDLPGCHGGNLENPSLPDTVWHFHRREAST